MRPLHATLTPGLPPADAAGNFIGQDRRGGTWLLRWNRNGHWEALGWEPTFGAPMPTLTQLAGDQQGLIVGHIEIAGSGAPAGPEGAAVLKGGTRPADRHSEGVRALGTLIEPERARIRRGLSELGYPLTADLIALLDPDLEMSAWELDQ